MTDQAALTSYIAIKFATIAETVKRGYAGTSQSRRRELSAAKRIATVLVAGIRINHRIERDGAPAKDDEVISFFADTLWQVPENTAKDCVGIDANKRDVARDAIARALADRLLREYALIDIPSEYRWGGPSVYPS